MCWASLPGGYVAMFAGGSFAAFMLWLRVWRFAGLWSLCGYKYNSHIITRLRGFWGLSWVCCVSRSMGPAVRVSELCSFGRVAALLRRFLSCWGIYAGVMFSGLCGPSAWPAGYPGPVVMACGGGVLCVAAVVVAAGPLIGCGVAAFVGSLAAFSPGAIVSACRVGSFGRYELPRAGVDSVKLERI